MQNTPSRQETDIQCAVSHWKDKPRLFATLRTEKRYFAPQISVLMARSGSSSPDSTRRQEALRRRFGRRTKAPWHSCGDSNLPQWPTDCRKPVEARTSRSRTAFSPTSVLPGSCSLTHEARHTGCWSPKVHRKSWPARQRKNAVSVLNICIGVDFSRDASDKYCSGI